MPPLENTDKDSSPNFPPAALVVKPKCKLVNTLSWNATDMTPPHDYATQSSIASSTSLQTTPKHLALTMDKVLLRRGSPEQKHSLHHLEILISCSLPELFIFLSSYSPFPFLCFSLLYLSRYCVLTMACLYTPCNKLMI